MNAQSTNQAAPALSSIHHMAFRCRDAAETREFYEGLLGLEFAGVFRIASDPETGAVHDYAHIFFRMTNGDFIAFFDDPATVTPDSFKQKNPFDCHPALKVERLEDLAAFKMRLEEKGQTVIGPINHDFCHSIYLYDPNGLPVEITAKDPAHDAMIEEAIAASPAILKRWAEEKVAFSAT